MDLDPTLNNTDNTNNTCAKAAKYHAGGPMFVGSVQTGDHTDFCKCYIIISFLFAYSLNISVHYNKKMSSTFPATKNYIIPSIPSAFSKVVFNVPWERNYQFVGRDDVFNHLESLLEKSTNASNCIYVALTGLGGIGKTQIALEYCYRNKNKYPYIFWIEANTETDIQSSYATATKKLNLLIPTNSSSDDIVLQLIQWLESHGEWLLVFDNADDYSIGNKSDPFRLRKK